MGAARSIASSITGLAGAVLLFWPGWRASGYLRQIEQVRSLVPAEGRQVDDDPGPGLLAIMEANAGRWRPHHHAMLLAGIALIVVSYAIDLFLVQLA